MRIELQVLGAALRSIADEMGAVLVRSAFSANIKERRDCSTALFDADGLSAQELRDALSALVGLGTNGLDVGEAELEHGGKSCTRTFVRVP